MWRWVAKAGSPEVSYRWAGYVAPWLAFIGCMCFFSGLYFGFYYVPPDYQQGDAFRIMYLHVPAAICSMGLYVVMSVASFIFLIWKIKVADAVAKVVVSVGALFTVMTLVTGALWGRPTWGAYWIWDARLTSELVLLFIYCGIMALRSAMPSPMLQARVCAMMTLIGFIDLPIIHFSVRWWNTLHQGASILKLGSPSVSAVMLHPLLLMIAAYICLSAWLILTNLRTELLDREYACSWVRRMLQED